MKRLHLICNAHLDPVWQWTSDEGMAAAIATFKSAADLADEFDYIFCHNEALLYESVEKYAPELFERIRKHIESGKWKIIGGWYIQPDCNMPAGETFVRQIKEGERYFFEKFGVKPTTACNFDSFGHSVGLVQILKKCGFDSYLITRPSGEAFDYPGTFFDWIGPDGSKAVVGRVPSYGSGMGHAAEKIINAVEDAEDVDFVLWGVGNHGGGPSRKDLKDIEELKIDGFDIFHSTPENLFHDKINILGETKNSLVTSMPGCYTSMAKIKQSHRFTENLLYNAEKLMSAAAMTGCEFDYDEMRKAQKKLLLAEFHDILPGTSVPDGEKEGLELLSSAANVFRENRMKAFLHLVMGEDTAEDGEYPVFVFNPLPYEVVYPAEAEFTLADQNWNRNTVSVPEIYQNGEKIPVQQIKENSTLNLDWRKKIAFEGRLKPMGITRFSVRTKLESKKEKEEKKADIDKLISSRELLLDQASLIMYDDTADPWAMSSEELKGLGKNPVEFSVMSDNESDEFCAVPHIKAEHIIEDGEVFTAVEKFFRCGNSRASLEYKFYKNHPWIDVKVNLEFAEKNKLVRLKLPIGDGRLCGDGPYVVENKGDNEVVYQKWLGIRKDDKITAVLNDCVYGGRKAENGVEITLIRGAGYLFHPIGDLPLYPEDRYLPRIDCGRYTYNFRILCGDASEITNEALIFNEKPYAVNAFPIASGRKNIDIHTDRPVNMPVCRYENGCLLMRFFNPEAKPKEFMLSVEKNEIRIELRKYEIMTVTYKNGEFSVNRDELILQ
ncbi:MAG: alpha-mannosidase [Clostridia bacterium]|nr:alpha-mannosidase [Clostridia bacterium]